MRIRTASPLLAFLLLFILPLSSRSAAEGGEEALRLLWEEGQRLYGEGDVAAAEETFQRALLLDRDQPRTWNYLGGIFFRKGDFDSALQHFKQALLLNPGDARACNNIATTYDHLEEHEKAKAFYIRTIKIDWKYPLPYRNLGVLYATHLRKPELARRFWNRFLKLVPSGPEAEAVRRELEELEKRESEAGEADSPP
jgi:Flp pilus assembly protein TadD